MYVREFLLQFAGMKGSAVQKAILDELGLARTTLADAFTRDGTLLEAEVKRLHYAVEGRSKPVHTRRLGAVGEAWLASWMASLPDPRAGEAATYKRVVIEDEGRPFIVEAAFQPRKTGRSAEQGVHVLVALNHSPVLKTPHRCINDALQENHVEKWSDQVTVAIHLICPHFTFTDRGKSLLDLNPYEDEAIHKALDSVLKGWKQMKRRLSRDRAASERDIEKLSKPDAKVTIKEAAYAVMEQAYLKASGDGKLPADARQVMYAARGQILAMTGAKELGSQYFCYGLLPDFQADNPELTANWDVVYGDRGNLFEPHTGRRVPLGTINVRNYVGNWAAPMIGRTVEATVPLCISTNGPRGRYGAALFIEKEGFTALFKAAQTAELYDVAIFSTKGMSTTASRSLVEHLSAEGIPIFLLHDFDASGMMIARTIQEDGRRFKFKTAPQVIEMGLRLKQAEEMGLESEPFSWGKQKKDPRPNLRDCGATEEEIAFLVQKGDATRGVWAGERVELNAMTSPQFVEFVHSQLEDHGVAKVVPDQDTLAALFQHVKQRDVLEQKVREAIRQIQQAETDGAESEILTTPENLKDLVRNLIDGTTLSWIDGTKEIARNH